MLLPGQNTVRGKMHFVVLATTLLALLLSGGAMLVYELRDFRQTWVNDLTAQADVIGLAAAPALQFQDPEAARDYLALLEAKPNITSAAIYTANGARFASYSADGDVVSFSNLPSVDGHEVVENELLLFRRIVANGEILGTVGLRADYDVTGRLIDYVGILLAIITLSLLGAVLISRRLQRTITEPIAAVTSVAKGIMERRDFTLRAPKSSRDEIGLLVDAFNDMLDELGRRAETLEEANRELERQVRERRRAEDAHAAVERRNQEDLKALNAELEDRVAARTAELEAANKELESFSYSVSHDLRAPLRAINGFANLLQEDHEEQLDDEARRKLKIIRGQAERMGYLIDDLLTFSRLGRKAIQPVELDMDELARNTFERVHDKADDGGLEFRVGKLPAAVGDRSLLEQVWTNLLSNAVKFSSCKETPVVEVGAIVEETENVYFVRDNGAGFDPRYRDKLFGVFQRLHDESEFPGTGVGLALVHRIVTRHGGRVWADSRPNDGATFHFSLPRESRE